VDELDAFEKAEKLAVDVKGAASASALADVQSKIAETRRKMAQKHDL
jgi:hypothetical protein